MTLQALTPFMSAPTFGILYAKTVDYFPQAVIYLMVGLKSAMLIDLVIINFLMKRRTTNSIDASNSDTSAQDDEVQPLK